MNKKNIAWAALLVFGLSSIAFAAQAAAAPAAAAAGDGHWWKGILQGVLGGLMASAIGYAKNKDTRSGEHEDFGVRYLIQTCIFGAIVGLIAGLLKKNPTDMFTSFQASPLFAGATMVFENVMKAIWRNGSVHLREMITDFKGGGANPTPPAPPTA